MIRLCVVVEGQTEEAFVKDVLGPHLNALDVFTSCMIVSTGRTRRGRKFKGGGERWEMWRRDLRSILLNDDRPELRLTTMFDLYGLPRGFPGEEEYGALPDTAQRAELLEQSMHAELGDQRFLPYLQRHEFEALVLAALDALEGLLDPPDRAGLARLREEVQGISPEDVDDGRETAPSKRLERHVPGYDKVLHGPLVACAVGLPPLRAACPRFNAWVGRLESLAGFVPPQP